MQLGTEATRAPQRQQRATRFPRLSWPGAPSVTINAGTALVPCLLGFLALRLGFWWACRLFPLPFALPAKNSALTEAGEICSEKLFLYITVVQTSSLLPFE
jgi:hypothetical protein